MPTRFQGMLEEIDGHVAVSVQHAVCILAEQAHLKVVIVVSPHRAALKYDGGVDEWKELAVVIDEA